MTTLSCSTHIISLRSNILWLISILIESLFLKTSTFFRLHLNQGRTYIDYTIAKVTRLFINLKLNRIHSIINIIRPYLRAQKTANSYTSNRNTYPDYYPFGMLMPERNGGSSYRYSFNGKEGDDEVKGNGNQIDFGARAYDSRLGRWFSLDALEKKYPYLSPYNFVANNPIVFIDIDGR